MDDDEVVWMLASAVVGLVCMIRWYWVLSRTNPLRRDACGNRWTLGLLPLMCIGLLWTTIQSGADLQVNANPGYLILFLGVGAVSIGIAAMMLPIYGISIRDDALERNNRAASIAVIGPVLGITFCNIGGNWGRGDTIYMTLGPILLAGVSLFALWGFVEMISRTSEAITIDRDSASALRLVGLLAAVGMILGRSVAGDFHSIQGTFEDFARFAWPAVLFAIGGTIVHRILRPTPSRPIVTVPTNGLAPALAYVLMAAGYVLLLGPTNKGVSP